MQLTQQCISALGHAGLFENRAHMSRFKELMNCFENYPFFSRGLCKCMYLSAWDDEHFLVMLETLNVLALDKSRDTQIMSDQKDELQADTDEDSQVIIQLSDAWLKNQHYDVPFERLTEGGAYIIRQGFKAAEIIDQLFVQAARQR